MNWREKYRPASFRGAAFAVADSDHGFGRNTVVHIFPQRDMPYVEDLGMRPKRFTVEAFVIGKDYMDKRDALIKALEQEGPGTLVHPFYGEVEVSLDGEARCREGVGVGGGMAVFSLPFVRDSKPSSPSATPNAAGIAGLRANAAGMLAGLGLGRALSLAGGSAGLAGMAAAVQRTTATVAAALRGDMGVLLDLAGDVGAALVDPALVGGLMATGNLGLAVYEGIRDAAETERGRGTAPAAQTLGLSDWARHAALPPLQDEAGISRRTAAANERALVASIREMAVVEAARAAALAVPESRAQAAELRAAVVAAVDVALEHCADAELFESLASLRSATVAALSKAAGQAPDVANVETRVTLPSLALAYRHSARPFGSLSLHDDLLARNRILHPGFVSPGTLEVLRYVD